MEKEYTFKITDIIISATNIAEAESEFLSKMEEGFFYYTVTSKEK